MSGFERIKAIQQISDDSIGITSDVCGTNLEDNSMDIANSTQVIKHVEDNAKMIRRMRRIVKPKGILYLTTIFKKSYG